MAVESGNIVITVEYLPGINNVIAGQESRHHRDASDWKLDTQIFSCLALRWGPFSVDLFAVRHNKQISTYRRIRLSGAHCYLAHTTY